MDKKKLMETVMGKFALLSAEAREFALGYLAGKRDEQLAGR